MVNFTKIITGNSQLDRVQTNIANAFNTIIGPFVEGNYLTGMKVGTSATILNHGLGRVPVIWTLGDQNTNTTVWRTAWDENTITLQAGSACTISLWVN